LADQQRRAGQQHVDQHDFTARVIEHVVPHRSRKRFLFHAKTTATGAVLSHHSDRQRHRCRRSTAAATAATATATESTVALHAVRISR